MIDSCVFCRVVAGTIEASVVHDDDQVLAFVDLRQPGWPRGGHVLVVPKPHVELIMDLPDDLAARLMQVTVRVSAAVQRIAAPEGISVWSSNGAAADQEVPHVHLHVLARFHGDGLLKVYPSRPDSPTRHDLDAWAVVVRGSMADPDQARPPAAAP